MIIFEAGKVVHSKWRQDLDAAKAEMGLMPPASRVSVLVSGRALPRGIFAHGNDNDSAAVFPPVSFSSVQKDIAS